MSLRACFRVDGLIKSGCGEKPQSLCFPSFRIQGHGGTRIVLSGPGGRINAGLSGRMSPLRKTRRFLLFETGLPAGTGRPSPASGKYAAIRSWRRLERTDKSVGLFIFLLFFLTYLFLYDHQFRQAVPESLCVSRIRCVNINFSISVSYMVLRLSQKQCLRQSGTRHIFVFSDRFPVSDVPVDRRS